MKTTKKGFTLIELIVVIAIIGVLAAILVPSMLGYVRKSKISSANSTASSVQKAFDSTLTDADAKGVKLEFDGWLQIKGGVLSAGESSLAAATANDILGSGIANYFDKMKKVDGYAYIKNTSCTAVVATTDGNYIGSFPSGYVEAKDYKTSGAFNGKSKAEKLKIVADRVYDDRASDTNDGPEITAQAGAWS